MILTRIQIDQISRPGNNTPKEGWWPTTALRGQTGKAGQASGRETCPRVRLDRLVSHGGCAASVPVVGFASSIKFAPGKVRYWDIIGTKHRRSLAVSRTGISTSLRLATERSMMQEDSGAQVPPAPS
eukprot:2261915-Rhodomonas_salina.1